MSCSQDILYRLEQTASETSPAKYSPSLGEKIIFASCSIVITQGLLGIQRHLSDWTSGGGDKGIGKGLCFGFKKVFTDKAEEVHRTYGT